MDSILKIGIQAANEAELDEMLKEEGIVHVVSKKALKIIYEVVIIVNEEGHKKFTKRRKRKP